MDTAQATPLRLVPLVKAGWKVLSQPTRVRGHGVQKKQASLGSGAKTPAELGNSRKGTSPGGCAGWGGSVLPNCTVGGWGDAVGVWPTSTPQK